MYAPLYCMRESCSHTVTCPPHDLWFTTTRSHFLMYKVKFKSADFTGGVDLKGEASTITRDKAAGTLTVRGLSAHALHSEDEATVESAPMRALTLRICKDGTRRGHPDIDAWYDALTESREMLRSGATGLADGGEGAVDEDDARTAGDARAGGTDEGGESGASADAGAAPKTAPTTPPLPPQTPAQEVHPTSMATASADAVPWGTPQTPRTPALGAQEKRHLHKKISCSHPSTPTVVNSLRSKACRRAVTVTIRPSGLLGLELGCAFIPERHRVVIDVVRAVPGELMESLGIRPGTFPKNTVITFHASPSHTYLIRSSPYTLYLFQATGLRRSDTYRSIS